MIGAALGLALLSLASAGVSRASNTGLTGAQGHVRNRFPLAVHLGPTASPLLDAVARRAVTDWNAVAREALGVTAFVAVADPAAAQVAVTFEPQSGPLMGVARITVGAAGRIDLPVRIAIFPPEPRGQTSREVLLYQVLAHELGHALGLPHTSDPRSLMCCTDGSLDFSDGAVRQAYVEARRHPDLGSVRAQLAQHYERFWKTTSDAPPATWP